MRDLRLLGSGGWVPTSSRETCCALVRDGDHALVIDAGTGIRRAVEDGGLLAGVTEVDVVLTHFHLDHVIGFGFLPALSLPKPPRVWAPGRRLYGTPSESVLRRLLEPPLLPGDIADTVSEIRDVPEDAIRLGRHVVRFRDQRLHSDPTLAVRIGDEVTYCTDTAFDEGNADFARGSRVLVHEAWYTEDDARDAGIHTSGRQAGRLARMAGVERLVLIHVNPLSDSVEALLREAKAEFPETVIGEDLLVLA